MGSSPTLPALRVLTCGSVDDGKSTLIGRLLHEQGLIVEDERSALARDTARHGTTGSEIDYALLVDGLEAEREQGITIDVAYRYFATSRRAFVIADTPGHEEYTRNMVTGASNADFAILLVDARKGLLSQTRRHAVIVSLLGIRHVALVINKMDLVGFEQAVFAAIVDAFAAFAASLGFASITPMPLSARRGDNLSSRSSATPWYNGPCLLQLLETIDVREERAQAFRLPVQWIIRPGDDVRGISGTVSSGTIEVGAPVMIAPSGRTSRVTMILSGFRQVSRAETGQAITLTLEDDVDVARGDMLCQPDEKPEIGDQFAAHVIWMSEKPMLLGRSYLMKVGPILSPVVFTELRHRLDVTTLQQIAAKSLALNELGMCKLATARPISFDPYKANRATGGFIVIDRDTNATVAAGMIDHHLRRSANTHAQAITVSRSARAAQKRQTPKVLWFTGLSGAGKSTIANLVEEKLHARGLHTMMLDGDNVRHGLNRDLGFTENARIENIRRVGEVSKLMTEAGLIVLCAFISPFATDRQMVRDMLAIGDFVELHVDVSIEEAIRRDPKGLYKRALEGKISNFTGIDQVYEPPLAPELTLDTLAEPAEALANHVVAWLERAGLIEST